MNRESKTAAPAEEDDASPLEHPPGTGEGAVTALEALIRKRRLQGGTPESAEGPPPPIAP